MNYLTLLEVADLLAEMTELEAVTASCIDEALTETIGAYQREGFAPRECVGGDSSYETAKLRIVVRWGTNPTTCETKSAEAAGVIAALRDMPTTAHIIKYAVIKAVKPIGKDEKGVCEYIIDADIIYTEREE